MQYCLSTVLYSQMKQNGPTWFFLLLSKNVVLMKSNINQNFIIIIRFCFHFDISSFNMVSFAKHVLKKQRIRKKTSPIVRFGMLDKYLHSNQGRQRCIIYQDVEMHRFPPKIAKNAYFRPCFFFVISPTQVDRKCQRSIYIYIYQYHMLCSGSFILMFTYDHTVFYSA